MGWMHPSNPSTGSVFGNGYINYGSMTAAAAAAATASCNPSQHASIPTAASIGSNHIHSFAQAQAQPPRDYNLYQCLPPAAAIVPSQNITQQSPSLYLHCSSEYSSMNANSNRMLRNMAEKLRRDKLNAYISELATLVPMVSSSPKRMDKTSILRLSATFLRMNQLKENAKDQENKLPLPQYLNSSCWPQSLLDEIDGIMLVVTSGGKIVFISHNIEKVLGHTQLELLGQSLYNITFPPDHAELKKYLLPDEEDDNCSDSDGGNVAAASAAAVERQRRSFCLRLRHRGLARSEQPQYEPVHIFGHLKVPKKFTCQAQKKSRKPKLEVSTANGNDIVLVAVMKPAREIRFMFTIEASQDEYVTRHLYDGHIIYADQRISQVSGYLPEEVKGLQAFTFMHKEEVRWVLIALRQMLSNREGFEKSCYRLKTITGDFIYLKTHGYLEPCEDVQHSTFVCVNTLVSSEEGEQEIQYMKKRFSVYIESKVESVILTPPEKHVSAENEKDRNTEDPADLKNAIKAMVSDIPAPVQVKEDPQKSRETQFRKAKLFSKSLPPVRISNCEVITVVEEKSSSKRDSHSHSPQVSANSPSTYPTQSQHRHHSMSSSSAVTPPSPSSLSSSSSSSSSAVVSRTLQDRPSVLRIAPPSRQQQQQQQQQPVTVYHSADSSTNNGARDSAAVYDNQRDDNGSNVISSQLVIKQECIKQETMDLDDFDRLQSQSQFQTWNSSDHAERTGVVRRVRTISNTSSDEGERTGVVVRRGAVKRHFDFEEPPLPVKRNPSNLYSTRPDVNLDAQQKRLQTADVPLPLPLPLSLSPSYQITFGRSRDSVPFSLDETASNDLDDTTSSCMEHFTQLSSPIEACDPTARFVHIDSFESRTEPDEVLQLLGNEDLKHSHIKLESKMHLQGAQIHAIEGDLNEVSFATEQLGFQNDLSQLKEQHVKQTKLLMTLQKDHHSLHQCNADNVNLTNVHQDVGV